MWRALRIGRRSLGRLFPGLVFDVDGGARLAFRLEPFERRPRSCRARLNLAPRPLPRGLPTTARSSRIVPQFLLEGGQTLADRGFDLEQFLARPERLPAGAG